jgi:hypothetical protein
VKLLSESSNVILYVMHTLDLGMYILFEILVVLLKFLKIQCQNTFGHKVNNKFLWLFLPELFFDMFLHYATSENGFSTNENLCLILS